MDHAHVYETGRERIAALLASVPDGASRPVPACPGWTVKEVVAHLAGLAGDWRAGNLAGYGGEEWTAAHVTARQDHDIEGIVAEWADHAAAIAPALADPAAAGLPEYMPMIVITDLAAHEHDIRSAVNRPGAQDSEAVHIGLASQIGGLRQHFARLGIPPLRVEALGVRDWMVGRGDPVATVRGGAFELFRATGGRRTRAQVRQLDWEGESEQFIENFLQPPYSWPEAEVEEADRP